MSGTLICALRSLAVGERAVARGEYLFHRDDVVTRMFVVLDGSVHLLRHQLNGAEIILQRAGNGEILAEASLHADRYHCGASAACEARLLVVPREPLRARLRGDGDLAEQWVRHLGRQLQRARFQCELLALDRVADRLDLWLDWHDGALPAKGEWTALARELGVSREALYREMKRRYAPRA